MSISNIALLEMRLSSLTVSVRASRPHSGPHHFIQSDITKGERRNRPFDREFPQAQHSNYPATKNQQNCATSSSHAVTNYRPNSLSFPPRSFTTLLQYPLPYRVRTTCFGHGVQRRRTEHKLLRHVGRKRPFDFYAEIQSHQPISCSRI